MAEMADERLTYVKEFAGAPACDVLVAGGGIAGCMAALAAARAGAETILVEGYGCLGGTPVISAGPHFCFCGDSAGQGVLFDELVDRLLQMGATVPYEPFRPEAILTFSHERWDYGVARYFDTTAFQLVLLELVSRQPHLKLWLHTRAVDAPAGDGRIETVIVHNKSGLQALRPRVVVDCTGDADLAAAAGFATVSGHEGDGRPIPMALFISLRDVGRVVEPAVPAPAEATEVDLPMVALTLAQDRVADFRDKIVGHDPTDGAGLTAAEIAGRRRVLRIVRHLQMHGYPAWKLDRVGTQVGVRIGRRIVGEYTLSVEDVRSGARFDDAIGRGTGNLTDMNLMDGSTDKQTHGALAVEVVPAYHIPYRCLVPRGSRNLLVAGRCMSADSWALSSARMMPACAMMGQAAGLAAARCASAGDDVGDADIRALQRALTENGARF